MSSLVFLAFSVILFIIVYGIMFLIVPTILGKFFTVLDPLSTTLGNGWQQIYQQNENSAQFLVPLLLIWINPPFPIPLVPAIVPLNAVVQFVNDPSVAPQPVQSPRTVKFVVVIPVSVIIVVEA